MLYGFSGLASAVNSAENTNPAVFFELGGVSETTVNEGVRSLIKDQKKQKNISKQTAKKPTMNLLKRP